jgi:hypothetical protein
MLFRAGAGAAGGGQEAGGTSGARAYGYVLRTQELPDRATHTKTWAADPAPGPRQHARDLAAPRTPPHAESPKWDLIGPAS